MNDICGRRITPRWGLREVSRFVVGRCPYVNDDKAFSLIINRPVSNSVGHTIINSVGQNSMNVSIGQHPTSNNVGQSTIIISIGQHPMNVSVGKHPMNNNVGQRPITNSIGQRPMNDSVKQQPTNNSVGQRPTINFYMRELKRKKNE